MYLSVALCTYNGSNFLAQQLQSIFSQTLSVNEIIVCDDKSKDDTLKIVSFYDRKYPGIIKVFKNNKTLGPKKNFEKAISLTIGGIIFLSDQDDVWISNKVSTIVSAFNKDNEAVAIFSNATLINEHNRLMEDSLWCKWGFDENTKAQWRNNSEACKQLAAGWNKVTGATMAFRKELKQYILPLDSSHILWHDGWISMKAAELNGLRFVDERLVLYRIHQHQQLGIGNGVYNRKAEPQPTGLKKIKLKV